MLIKFFTTVCMVTFFSCGKPPGNQTSYPLDEKDTAKKFTMLTQYECTLDTLGNCSKASNDGRILVYSVLLEDADSCLNYSEEKVMATSRGEALCNGAGCWGGIKDWNTSHYQRINGRSSVRLLQFEYDYLMCLLFDTNDSQTLWPDSGDIVCDALVSHDERLKNSFDPEKLHCIDVL